MPVKFWQMIVRFWYFLSYLITTVLKIPLSVLFSMLAKNGEGGLPVPPVLNNGGKHTAHSNIITDASWVNIGKKEQKNPLSFSRTVINNQ